jgi:two-component sensor histidine kinase
VFHELATNAAKYGALSDPGGRIAIDVTRQGGGLVIRWRELGGPAVAGPPVHTGFGTRLAEMSIENQLGGVVRRTWSPEGLQVEIEVLVVRLNREAPKT